MFIIVLGVGNAVIENAFVAANIITLSQSTTLDSPTEHDNTTLFNAYMCVSQFWHTHSDYPYIERNNMHLT